MHPDFDSAENAAGLRLTNRGSIDMVEEHASVRQALLLLLSTRPGERIMRPNYGCNLHRLVFAPNDQTTAGLAIHYGAEAPNLMGAVCQIARIDAAKAAEAVYSRFLGITFFEQGTVDTADGFACDIHSI